MLEDLCYFGEGTSSKESGHTQKKVASSSPRPWQQRLAVPGVIFSTTRVVTSCFYDNLSPILCCCHGRLNIGPTNVAELEQQQEF